MRRPGFERGSDPHQTDMRFGGGFECTVALAFGDLATWLDSSLGVNWCAAVHATATVTGPEYGHEQAGPDGQSEEGQQPSPEEDGEESCPGAGGEDMPAVEAPLRSPPHAALPPPDAPSATGPPPAMAGLGERAVVYYYYGYYYADAVGAEVRPQPGAGSKVEPAPLTPDPTSQLPGGKAAESGEEAAPAPQAPRPSGAPPQEAQAAAPRGTEEERTRSSGMARGGAGEQLKEHPAASPPRKAQPPDCPTVVKQRRQAPPRRPQGRHPARVLPMIRPGRRCRPRLARRSLWTWSAWPLSILGSRRR